MASIKVKFRESAAGGEGTVYYQIIHGRKVRRIATDYRILTSEWDSRRSAVKVDYSSARKSVAMSIRERIRCDVERLSRTVRTLCEEGLAFTADDIVDRFRCYAREYSLFNFMESVIIRLKQNDKLRTAETYRCTLSNFRRFRDGEDIMLDRITPEIMEAYQAWQNKRGISPNTSSFYMRVLRAVYNRAVELDVIQNRNPFRKVYTGVEKTVKRALPIGLLKKIKTLDLSLTPDLDYARDMFLMSFYLRGMSFIDMAYLKKSNLCNGYVTYRRRKTGQQLIIGWTKEMQTILDKYPANKSCYLLPIILSTETNSRNTYRNKSCIINYNLKKIARRVGVSIPLTLYVARHSWASAAKAKGIPLSVISEGMGHDSEMTTKIYLASLDTSVVDRANAIIISSLR